MTRNMEKGLSIMDYHCEKGLKLIMSTIK